MIIVATGSRKQFEEYCLEKGLNPRDLKQVVYATEYSLRGIRLFKDDKVLVLSTFSEKSFREQDRILTVLQVLEATRSETFRH